MISHIVKEFDVGEPIGSFEVCHCYYINVFIYPFFTSFSINEKAKYKYYILLIKYRLLEFIFQWYLLRNLRKQNFLKKNV